MIPKRRNLISLIFIVSCISKCSLIRMITDAFKISRTSVPAE